MPEQKYAYLGLARAEIIAMQESGTGRRTYFVIFCKTTQPAFYRLGGFAQLIYQNKCFAVIAVGIPPSGTAA